MRAITDMFFSFLNLNGCKVSKNFHFIVIFFRYFLLEFSNYFDYAHDILHFVWLEIVSGEVGMKYIKFEYFWPNLLIFDKKQYICNYQYILDMISIAERHIFIKEQLSKNGYIRVQDIADQLGVTGATIRKDLRILESQNVLIRAHGSASPVKPHVMDISIQEKSVQHSAEKLAIAVAAQKLIRPDDAIILASGSTVTAFAEQLQPINSINVVTPSIGIAVLMNEKDDAKVLLLGGEMYKNSLSVRGIYAEAGLKNVSCSKVFIGCDGIDISTGITCATIEEARLTNAMMAAASQTVILADSSKFGRRGFGKIGALEDFDIIITDAGIPKSLKEKIEEAGVQIIIA